MSASSPSLIAIETSTELASVALLHQAHTRSLESAGAQTHSMTVPRMITILLKEAGLVPAQCEAIAFGAGPGSFTGVRTACGLAQGLSFGAGLPVVPVVTLLAMAERARASCGDNDILVVLDARMGEVYWAQYRFDQGWQALIEPGLSAASQVTPQGMPVVCGNGLHAYAESLSHLQSLRAIADISPHARDIAALAAIELAKGNAVPARDAQPIYLRNKVALTTRERLGTGLGAAA